MPKRYLIPVFVPHLGCPNNCVFCNQNRISGESSPATGDTVRRAIEAADRIIPKGEPAELAFYGGSFTAIPEMEQTELLEAAAAFLKRDPRNSLRISTRPDCIDDRTVERLKKYGVATIELGAQSMCDDVLELSGRGHTSADTERAAEIVKNNGLALILQMMTGLPGDTFGKSMETAKRIIALKPDGVRIYPTVVVKDTPLYDMFVSGEYPEHTVEEAVRWCSELVPMFEAANIPVIRLGLNPSGELSGGAAAGGAYHPALGELVYSEIYRRNAAKLISGIVPARAVTLGVAAGRVSFMTGQKRRNIRALCDEFGLESVKVTETNVNEGEIVILDVEKK